MATLESDIVESVRLASLAPSAHNTQPWAVSITGSTALIKRSAARTLQVADPTTRQACLSVGMFLEALVIAGDSLGLSADVRVKFALPSELDLAAVSFDPNPRPVDAENALLAGAIDQRHTNRAHYDPVADLGWLDVWEPRYGSTVEVYQGDEREAIGEMVADAMRLALQLPAMRHELASLVHWPRDAIEIGRASCRERV